MATMNEVIARIKQDQSEEFEDLAVEGDNGLTVTIDDESIYLSFVEHTTDDLHRVFVEVEGVIESLWPCDPELIEWAVRNGTDYLVGTLVPTLDDTAENVTLTFRYRTLADCLTADAACVAVYAVAEARSELFDAFHDWYGEHI